jgi:uncharacterized membrane protein
MMFGAMLLALVFRWIDNGHSTRWLPWIMATSAEDARSLLSVIATSVLGVAGVTFSITIVAVSFASSNYGPRLINNFMSDKGSQYTLGTFIGTFVYCLTVLTNVHGSVESESGKQIDAFVPHLSISVAMLLTFASISVLIFFIHHITENINVENIIAQIGRTLAERITQLFPSVEDGLPLIDDEDFETAIHGRLIHEVRANGIGYIQTINLSRLSTIAEEEDLLIRVHYRPGDFTCDHDCLLSVWTTSQKEVPHDSLCQCFATGQERTEHQNVLFLVEQLSEVIARALSPGINDPFTAISCLNWFRTALIEYVVYERQAGEGTSGGGDSENSPKESDKGSHEWRRARVQLEPIGLLRLCEIMFDQTRQYVAADRNVTLHTLALLCECAWHAGPGASQTLLMAHMRYLHESSTKCLANTPAAQEVSERYAQAVDIVNRKTDMGRLRHETSWFGGSA